MKNIFTKVNIGLVALIAIAAIFVPLHAAHASTTSFNTDPQDRSTLRVTNSTLNPGCTTCWTQTISGVRNGDYVSFAIYYHNTGTSAAQNTRVRLTTSPASNGVQASGYLWADNASTVSGSASAYFDSALQNGELAYDAVLWYPNQSQTPTALPGGQSGQEVLSSGVNIGTINPGWPSQGSVVVRFRATGTTPPTGGAPIVITNSATNVQQNSATVNGSVNPNGANTTYWFEYGTSYSLGNTTTQQNAGAGTSAQSVSASLTGLLANTTYYFRIDGQNQYGTSQGSILSFTTGGQQGSAPIVVTNSATNVQQTSATLNGSVNPNGSATMYWFEIGTTQSLGNQSPQQDAGSGTSAQQVTLPVSSLQQNTTYYFRIDGQNQYGTSQGSILSFTTGGQQGSAPIVITNSATNVQQNSATVNGSVNPNGANTTYWFEYGTSYSLGNTTTQQNAGAGTSAQSVSASLTGLLANTTYYFRIDGQNQYGTSQGSILSFTTGGQQGSAPIVVTNSATNVQQTSATLNGSVNPNGSATTYWFEIGTTYSLGTQTPTQSAGSGTSAQQVNVNVSSLQQNTTYYFRIDGQNQYGTSQGSILSFTTGSGNQGSAPIVQTNSATNIQQNSAMLNGTVNPNGANTAYWFEYGTSYNLGNTTMQQNVGSGTYAQSVSTYISGLQNNTTYYFRIDGQNQYGTSQGSILSFTTGNGSGSCGGTIPFVQTNAASNVGQNSATLNANVSSATSDMYGWFVYGTDANNLYQTTSNNNVGSYNYGPFSQSLYNLQNNTTYYYQAIVRNGCGTWYGQVLNFNTSGGYSNGQMPTIITDPATSVAQNSAMLNGRVNPNGLNTTAWFEYGATFNLGLRTNSQTMGSGTMLSNYSLPVTGLAQNTVYYFRAVGQNQYGIAYGSTLSFTTSGGGGIIITQPTTPTIIQRPVIINTTTQGTGLSCLMLVPALDVSQLVAGQQFTYTVTYRNGCNFPLNAAFLKVILPTDVDFVSTNYPFYNKDANGLSYNLGVVPQGFQSAISLTGVVHKNVLIGNTLVFSAVLNFNDAYGHLQSVAAYLTAMVAAGSALSASVFDAFAALLGNWIFDLILFLILLLAIIYWIFFRKKEMTVTSYAVGQPPVVEDEGVDVLRA
ncbi:MAG: fibronectin type III domain-containing protein [Candidatus Paceibacterota bacterium]